MKRFFDVASSLVGLTLLFIPMLAIALAIRATIGSPVLFFQERPGLGGKPFRLVKFRTMTADRDRTGVLKPDSERLTPFGRFLRSTSLDELPEFWNVLTGDMSLVGPRPLLMSYLPLYDEHQARRHCVRPGITGWAQVNGRNSISWAEKFDMDVWYVDNWSLWLDIRILWMTVGVVSGRRGVDASAEVTMPAFTGKSERP